MPKSSMVENLNLWLIFEVKLDSIVVKYDHEHLRSAIYGQFDLHGMDHWAHYVNIEFDTQVENPTFSTIIWINSKNKELVFWPIW